MPAAIAAAKQALRTEMRAVRGRIAADPADRLARSTRIWARIVSLTDLGALSPRSETQRAQMPNGIVNVMLFESRPTEPDTAAWYAWCRDRDVATFRPVVAGADLRVDPGDLDPAVLDVVVVPGLAFTADGRRLGQGGGHYDRFLVRLRPDCITVGAAFVEQIVVDVPVEPHDVRMTHVATDA
ncbi:MAG: 5-formyltetrahydrofolate cyclo-ligase [Ilumatobacteraceae bacterium]